MVEALNLVVFAVTVRLAAHGIHPKKIAKPSDSTGSLRPIFANEDGVITFSSVQLTYPSRPTSRAPQYQPHHHPGESVVIVGASWSGRFTMVALLVPFDIAKPCTAERDAPLVGLVESSEEAQGLQGGHTQGGQGGEHPRLRHGSPARLRHARRGKRGPYSGWTGAEATDCAGALVHLVEVLETDECTSAHDPEDQRAVPDVIGKMKTAGGAGRSTATATHNSEVTKMCDRMLGLADGMVKEEGRFEELVRRKGVFATPRSRAEYIAEVPQATDEHGARVVRLFPPGGSCAVGVWECVAGEVACRRIVTSLRTNVRAAPARPFSAGNGGIIQGGIVDGRCYHAWRAEDVALLRAFGAPPPRSFCPTRAVEVGRIDLSR
ncbi:hypothetical protein LshimejAT787_1502190 [Lyophyllum shimeji]|uniref:Uncharacterized protein n=1 Tax=Lyophyllum shimeji TaxID=47721 RepID=A0A9P3UTV2_LYOSH|nr:hypothetical protein LshimejAT787_1502190 [Lyophyllum shimeji]